MKTTIALHKDVASVIERVFGPGRHVGDEITQGIAEMPDAVTVIFAEHVKAAIDTLVAAGYTQELARDLLVNFVVLHAADPEYLSLDEFFS